MKFLVALVGDLLFLLESWIFHGFGGSWEVLFHENRFLQSNNAPVIHNAEMEYNLSYSGSPGEALGSGSPGG